MNKRNIVAFLLTLASIGLLIPGLILPILSIKIGAEIPILGELNLHNTKQSIVETVQSLFENGNGMVAFLILLFSIIVPIVKAILLTLSTFWKNEKVQQKIHVILGIIGKWSMADVFIVALFIAFLSTSSEDNIHAGIHEGFYYFLGYCILSIISFQIFDKSSVKE